PNVDVGDAAVRTRSRHETLRIAHVEGKDGRRQPGADRVVQRDRLVELGKSHDVEYRRERLPQHRAGLVRHFTQRRTDIIGVMARNPLDPMLRETFAPDRKSTRLNSSHVATSYA